MPGTFDETNAHAKLRRKAEAHLQAGTAPANGQGSIGVDALRLLHQLSSDPEKAADALKLLHELQVHQVEVDLQNEEIAAHEQALEVHVQFYQALYDYAPVGYFVVDAGGLVIQSNLTAAEYLGVDRDDLEGQRIATFLDPTDQPLLAGMLQRVAESGAKASCLAAIKQSVQGFRHFHFQAATLPESDHILLTCCASDNSE